MNFVHSEIYILSQTLMTLKLSSNKIGHIGTKYLSDALQTSQVRSIPDLFIIMIIFSFDTDDCYDGSFKQSYWRHWSTILS
jgi:hypothetical protein